MRFTDERLSLTHPYNQHRNDERDRTTGGDSTESDFPGSLIVVSNRQPYRHKYTGGDNTDSSDDIAVDEPTGGLTAGLDPVLQHTNGTWIAWGDGDADFDVTDEDNCVTVPPESEAYTLRRLDLSDEAVESYYYGFSNQVLWPICHGFPELVTNRSEFFEWYQTVNERFAEAVASHASADSTVWLQDYHFGLAPRLIRDAVPSSTTVAQFWHIPWPTPETYQQCPAGGHVLEGVLGNDLLGFHVDRYVDNFLDCVDRYLPAASVDRTDQLVEYDGETTRIVATPMGVDVESYDEEARAVDTPHLSSLFDRYDIPHDTVLGLGVDRLDYSKGIPERLVALERFFERNPDWRGEFTFVQKATPSRTDIPTYQEYGNAVRTEVERINDRFATDDWQPIVYTEAYLESNDLSALYRHADVMVVSPLVDGMNLVAQEYVAASVDSDGTLLLSDRTGAHELLGSHALTIDPTDTDEFAVRIEEAVSMPPQERHHRMNVLRNRVFDANLESWMDDQFDWIRRTHDGVSHLGSASDTDHDSDPDSPEQPPSV
ncbi:trehalose-6-phosphate synthase [Natrialbaceae archaeon A-arb3/5]